MPDMLHVMGAVYILMTFSLAEREVSDKSEPMKTAFSQAP